jgi:outer membrane protein assembly factor BamA/autotransporter translocation and assembly factor TamB
MVTVRAVLKVAAVAAVCAAALLLLLHAPFVRRAAFRYAVAAVEAQYGLRLEASRLDYNLAAFHVGLADLRLSALHAPGEPFLEADYLSVTLPVRTVLGLVAFEDISVANARVRIRRRRDGTTNLPAAGERPTADPPPLRIERLDIPQLAVDLSDEIADLTVQIPAVALRVTPDEGHIAFGRPAELRVGARDTRISELNGTVTFDGRALHFDDARIRADEALVRLDGTLALISREPSVEVRAVGTGDVARLARWGIAEGELPRGTVDFDAQLSGPLSSPRADVRLTAERLSWQNAATTAVSARLAVERDTATLEDAQLGFAGGRITVAALLRFEPKADGTLNATFHDVDAAAATVAFLPDADLVPTASLSGRLDFQGALSDPATWSGSLRMEAAAARNARGRIAIPGTVAIDLRDGHWQLDGTSHVASVAPVSMTVRGAVVADRRGDSPLQGLPLTDIDGTFRLRKTDLAALFGALRTLGITEPSDDAVTRGTVEADVAVRGSVADPSLDGRAVLRDVAGPEYRVALVTATLAGKPMQRRLDFSVEAPAGEVGGQSIRDVRAAGALSGTALVVDVLSAGQLDGSGTATATGDYAFDTGRYTASLDVSGWSVVARPDAPLAGRVNLQFSGAGTVEAPRGTGRIVVDDTSWQEVALGRLEADVGVDGQVVTVDARAPEFEATATARVGLAAPYDAVVEGESANLDLSRVLRGVDAPIPIGGRMGLSLRYDGPLQVWRSGAANLEVVALDATANDLPIRLAQPARVRYEAERILVDSLEADAGDTRISARGELAAFDGGPDAAGFLFTVTGDVGEVARAAAAAGLADVPVTGGTGPVALLARVTGSLETPVVAADLEAGPGSITLRDLPPVSGLRLRAHAENGWLEVREGAASYQNADIAVTARAPLSWVGVGPDSGTGGMEGNAVIHARATNLTPAVLGHVLDPTTIEQLSGSVDASLDLASRTPSLSAVTGELRLDRLDVRVADLSVGQRVPTRVAVRDGFARVEAWDWVGQGATLAVRGQVRLEDRQSAILANGVVDLRILTPFVRDVGMTTFGRLEPRLSVTGPIDNPRIDGDVIVSGGEVRLVDPRVLVSDITARTVLTRTTARVTTLSGTVNGGALTGSGTLDYSGTEGLDVRFSTSIRGMALEFPEGLRSEVDADLDLDLDLVTPAGLLSGTVTVVRGAYREPLAVVTGLLAGMRTERLSAAAGAPPSTASPILSTLNLDMRLLTDEDIIVDNNYGQLQLGADLGVIGTAAAPALAGRAELREGGQLFIGRNVYTIESGTIDFVNPATIEPLLNVDASTSAGGEDIEVTITGSADSPRVDLRSSSNPDLGQAEIASVLLTGRRLEDLAPDDAAFVGTQVLGNFSAEVLGFASRAIGLDTLRLGGPDAALRRDPGVVATDIDPTTRLTFGKSLGANVDLTFSQSLRNEDAQTWILEYRPARGLELRLVSDDKDLRSYGFRHNIAFGGPPRVARAGAAARDAIARVASIGFSGDSVLSQAQLVGLIRMSEGDRFDFAAWQSDRDRIEEAHHRAGHLTARVVPQRSEGADGVMLNYQIAAGPETQIVVTGLDATGSLRARLEAAWIQSVFDDFLVDDATSIVREELARGGYFQPAIAVEVVQSGNTKTLSIMVDPRSRTDGTLVRVEGAEQALADGIVAHLASRGLVNEAISRVEEVEREAAAYLRAAGHLRARVTVGAPMFEPGPPAVAVVPVTVDAGPALTIAGVSFDGAARLADSILRDATALPEGIPYDPIEVDAARNRLVALYRREGFPSAGVTAHPNVRTDSPRVDLAFVVMEGAREVLDEVVVTGNRAIDADVVTRALGLEVNAPLRADELLQGRARIFETGLFRRVDVAAVPAGGTAPRDPSLEPMRVTVTVEEWPALRVRYGLEVAEERPEASTEGRDVVPGVSADLIRRTLFGRAVTTGGALDLQRRERRGRIFLSTGTLFGLPVGSSLTAEQSHEEFTAATLVTDRRRLTWEQRARIGANLSLSYAYTFERNHTFDTQSFDTGELGFDITINIARLNAAAAWDTRDDPSDTVRGSLASFSLEYAPEAVGSDIRFIRQVAQAYHFRPWRRTVLASAARLGVVVPLGGQELIVSERFFAGGARTVRGIEEDTLGGRDVFGDPAGGRLLVVLNQEVRVPIYNWLRGVGFIDAGNVFARPSDASLRDLVGSIGFGLRLASPFALLRVDYGRSIWGAPDAGSGRWTFGIGQAF